jgi:hypothetical protein
LGPVLDAIEILTPIAVRFAGEAPIQVTAYPAVSGGKPAPDPLVATIQGLLYLRCYSHRLGIVARPAPQDPQLLARLIAANQGRERWDGGWEIYSITPEGRISVLKGDRQRSAAPGEYIVENYSGAPPQIGATVMLRVVRDSQVVQPGFYYMFGEALGDMWDEVFLTRFYFNCTATHVAELIANVTHAMNRTRVPFRMKALTDSGGYTRTDSMVLYCARRYFAVVNHLLALLPPPVLDGLESAVPLFTKCLRPGIGFAEDPGNGESFGMNRCQLLAEAIVSAWRWGRVDSDARFEAAAAVFQAAGLSIDQPYLAAGSVDVFETAVPSEVIAA